MTIRDPRGSRSEKSPEGGFLSNTIPDNQCLVNSKIRLYRAVFCNHDLTAVNSDCLNFPTQSEKVPVFLSNLSTRRPSPRTDVSADSQSLHSSRTAERSTRSCSPLRPQRVR